MTQSSRPTTDVEAEPVYPIRDDTMLGATEDLDRQPDGVPHDIVGRTTLAAYAVAVLLLAICATADWLSAVIAAAFAVPIIVWALRYRSARERDPAHPSL
jgi:hypothetical protein